MLMQSPPMQAAGKSHSSISVGDKRGGKSQRLTPSHSLRLPGLHTEPQVGPTSHAPFWIWRGLDRGGPGLFTGSSWTWGLGNRGPGVRRNGSAPQLWAPLTLAVAPVS